MDALKAELLKKRKAQEAEQASRPSKYMRRGEIEKLKQAEKSRTASPAAPGSQVKTSFPRYNCLVSFIALSSRLLILLLRAHDQQAHLRLVQRHLRRYLLMPRAAKLKGSISRMKRQYTGFVQKASLSAFSTSQTEIAAFGYERSNYSKSAGATKKVPA